MNKAFEKILEKLEELQNYACFPTEWVNEEQSKIHSYYANKLIEILKLTEQYSNGWIPCSERLPDNDRKQYIVQKTNGLIDILGFTKDAYKLDRYDFAEYKGKKKQLFYDYDSEYGYSEWECEAWQPLPEPYKERD